MKKIIPAVLLSAMILFCGCGVDAGSIVTNTEPQASSTPEASAIVTPEATTEPAVTETPAITETPLPTPKDPAALIEALTARIKHNADTETIEGFTWKSTYQDVFEGADTELRDARVESDTTSSLKYQVGGILIEFSFSDTICSLYYKISIGMPDFDSAANLMEKCMSSLQNVLGTPEFRNYNSDVFDFETAEEVKESGYDSFDFYAHWDCIQLSAHYTNDKKFSLSILFTEEDSHG